MIKTIRGLPWNLTTSFLRPAISKNFYLLKNWQYLDPKQTLDLQHQKMISLLSHAGFHVPYYQKTLREVSVINASGQINLEHFSDIPLLDKTIIRTRLEELKSDDLPKRNWFFNTSGGSTGEPVRFIQDQSAISWVTAATTLDDLWSDYRVGKERCLLLWGSERDLFVGKETLKIQMIRWMRNEVWINAFQMTAKKMHKYVEKINALKPVQILAYAESIYELSRFVEREGLKVYCPRAIKSSAGTLYSDMRQTIERVFHCPVFNRYGSREVSALACECEQHTGLHIIAPLHYIEILRADGSLARPGEMGEIVVTSLTNYAMPLIRYRIGDMGVLAEEPCICGRGWPLLKEVVGRVTDVFLTKAGDQIHGEYFTHLFYFQNWVRKFQVIQEDFDFIRVLVILHEQVDNPQDYYASSIEPIVEKIHFVMGQNCRVKFEFVDDINPTASGKYRYIISKTSRRADISSQPGQT